MAEDDGAAGPVVRRMLKQNEVMNFRAAPRDWTVWLVRVDWDEGYRLDDKMNNGGKWPPGRFVIPADDFTSETTFWLVSLHIGPGADPVAIYRERETVPDVH